MLNFFVTGHNEVVAKVMFLQVCVCPQEGRGCLPQCMLGCQTLPDQADHPPRPGRPSQDQADPPWTRQTPPWTRQTTPPTRQTPLTRQTPWTRQTPPWDQADYPPGKQTPAYGLRAAGTHPTGMHASFT